MRKKKEQRKKLSRRKRVPGKEKNRGRDYNNYRRGEEGKQQTGRKGREKSWVEREKKRELKKKFSCGKTQMRKTERVNDWAGESRDGRKPVVF